MAGFPHQAVPRQLASLLCMELCSELLPPLLAPYGVTPLPPPPSNVMYTAGTRNKLTCGPRSAFCERLPGAQGSPQCHAELPLSFGARCVAGRTGMALCGRRTSATPCTGEDQWNLLTCVDLILCRVGHVTLSHRVCHGTLS